LLRARNLPASFLKYADEQGVCAFVAVVRAIAASGQPIDAYSSWSVLGIPRYPGRILGAASIRRFFDEGVRGISPHVIPQSSTHAISGLISVGLGMGGPNLGAGGGLHSLHEGLLTACTIISTERVPGLWVVATAWSPEPAAPKNTRVVAEGQCHAIAFSLTAEETAGSALRLEMRRARSLDQGDAFAADTAAEPAALLALGSALERHLESPAGGELWRLDLGWGAELALVNSHSS